MSASNTASARADPSSRPTHQVIWQAIRDALPRFTPDECRNYFTAAVGALVGVLGPLAGGMLLSRFGPAMDFGVAALFALLSVLPLTWLREIPAGPVPDLRQSVRLADRAAIATFAADGWMASGLTMAWPMVLFLALGSTTRHSVPPMRWQGWSAR
jgi:hypothetical protein